MTTGFESLAAVVEADAFPEVDLALRRGRHIGRDDGDWYALLTDAGVLLERFYQRFGCELVHRTDGYFYLRPTSDQLGKRHLSVGEMLVGQVCALMYLDPASLETSGVIKRDVLLQRLDGLVGREALVKALNPRKRKHLERIGEGTVRSQVDEALRGLEDLGLVELLDDGVRLRSALMRFVDPVKTADVAAGLEKLIKQGEIVLGEPDTASDEEAP